MRASEKGRGPGARVAAGLASAFVFVTGAVMLTYVFEVRGSGFQAELAGVHGSELMILGGGLVLLTAAAFVVVSVLAGRASSGSKLPQLVQRARKLDVNDPEALKEFDGVPDLRDMVAELVTEKAHARELSDRFEGLRREIDGLVEGMRRSAEEGGRLREEGSNSDIVQLAVMWNGIVDRLRDAEEAGLGMAPVANVPRDVAVPEIRALVARLDELESELGRLRGAVGTPAAVAQREGQWAEPFEPTSASPASPTSASPASVSPPPTPQSWGEVDVGDTSDTVGWNPPPEEPPVPAVEEPTRPAREFFLDDDTFGAVDGYVEVASDPEGGTREAHRMTDPFAPQSLLPSGLAEGPAPVRDAAGHKAQRGPTVAPSSAGPDPAKRELAASAPLPPLEQAAPESPAVEDGMRFPEFVGGPGKFTQGRVELTYENQDPEDVAELPASALLFENNSEDGGGQAQSGEAVFDLRSFGVTESDQ